MDNCFDISILIVDDETEIREGLSIAFPWDSYSVAIIGSACDGEEALNMIQKYHPDIVITDIHMPNTDGLMLVKRTADLECQCKFVILSGYDDFHYAKTAMKYGVKDYLLKPVKINELIDAVNRLKDEIRNERAVTNDRITVLQDLKKARALIRKNQFISQLLNGEISETELEKNIKEYSLPIKNTFSIAVLLRCAHHNSDDSDMGSSRDVIFVQNELEAWCKDYDVTISGRGEDKILLISNLPFADGKVLLTDFLERFINHIHNKTSLKMFASLGLETLSLMEIAKSYQAAVKSLSWHIYESDSPVMDSSVLDYKDPPAAISCASVLDSLLQKDINALELSLERYFNEIQYIPAPPPHYVYSMCNYLIVHIQNSVVKYTKEPLQSFFTDPYLTLQKLETFVEIKLWMRQTLMGFLNELQIRALQQDDPVFEKTMDFISKNIFKKIKTEDICTHVGFSKNYFTTYFKNKTQLNFRDYILELKISYAQEQLKTSSNSPKELAIMLGYEDYRSFNRAFKARTGFAPSEYQKKYNSSKR